MVHRLNTNDSFDNIQDSRLAARLLKYVYPYRWSAVGASALAVLNAPLATAGPLLTKAAIDLYLLPGSSMPASGYVLRLKRTAEFVGLGGSRRHGLVFIAILFLVANLAQSAAQYLQVVMAEGLGQRAIHDLRQEIFSHLQKIPVQIYDRNSVGGLMTRLTADVDAINEMLRSGTILVLGNVILVLYTLFWMFRINRFLALLSCAILLLIVGFTFWFQKMAKPAVHYLREQIAAINTFLQEHLNGMQVVQIFTRESREKEKFKVISQEHWRAGMATTVRNAMFYSVTEAMALAGIALLLWFGGGQVIREIMSVGTLVAFIQLGQAFYDPVVEISSRYPVFQTALASSERIFALLDMPVETSTPQKPARVESACGRIEFRNVWFAYKPGDWVLKNVSFTVEPGEKAAFVGRTGTGKTTITNLLLRFYEIQRGQILLDDVDIREIDLQQLRSHFAVVSQEVALFSGDVTSNIRLGNPAISEEMVRMAAREVHLDQFVRKLPKGYQSEVSERGAGLSVGQKQLVSFARALAFNRSILILDEATSSIDPQMESLISDAVQRIMTGRTALVIAHRLSTIQSVDKIFVMHNGEIRECGDHKSLLSRQGIYWKLYQLQFGREPGSVLELKLDAKAVPELL
jgi:ATP-binding cassette subfamily B protein